MAMFALALAYCCEARADYMLKATLSGIDFDWSSDDSYEGGSAPSSAGAYVCIPDGMVAKLSAADVTSWTFVNEKVARIRPMGMTSKLVADVVTANSPATLMSEVTYTGENTSSNYDRGGMEKTGDGELKLGASGKYSYFTTITVSYGTLSLYDGGVEDKYYFDTFNVSADATMNIIGTTADAKSITVCRKFFGEGTINCRGGALQTYDTSLLSEFSGRLTGTSSRMLTVCSPIVLSGTNSTASGNVSISASKPLYVKSFGRYDTDATVSSSLGTTGSLLLEGSAAGLVYIGEGETTDLEISLRSTSGINYIDAGATGGLTLESKVAMGNVSAEKQHVFAIQGSNTVESVFSCRLVERWDDNSPANYCPYHLVKRGTGTWRMAHVSNTMLSGGISVEEGTLKYDTIADAGTLCSLGYATNLYGAYTKSLSELRREDWAISLGTSEGAEGTIEYSGTSDVFCMTRPIALKGDGRIRQNVEKQFRFFGISSDGENAKTLTLDGSGTGGNEIYGITDADGGAISVAKDGSGTWTLAVSNSFRGALLVNGGTLNVCAPNWNWFRFIDKQGFTNETYTSLSKVMYIRELGFFDRTGMTQTLGLQFTDNMGHVRPGEFAMGDGKTWSVKTTGREWNCLFDDTTTAAEIQFASNISTENESSWVPVTIRLPEDSNPIASFDISYPVNYTKNTRAELPCFFCLEGSMDGITGKELFATNNVCPLEDGSWMTSGKYSSAGKMATTAHHGVTLDPPLAVSGPLDSASSVIVATNCTLRSLYGTTTLHAFGIDMRDGGGTVDGFTFAENGTIRLYNISTDGVDGKVVKSFTPVNCTGVENMSNWDVAVLKNGSFLPTTKFAAAVAADGTVTVTMRGFRLVVR